MEKTKKIDVRFKDWSCTVQMPLPTYGNGRKAICLIDAEDGQPIATATVNIPDAEIENDEVIIKNYSENEGMVEALVEAKIIEKPHRFVSSGWLSKIPVCKLLLT